MLTLLLVVLGEQVDCVEWKPAQQGMTVWLSSLRHTANSSSHPRLKLYPPHRCHHHQIFLCKSFEEPPFHTATRCQSFTMQIMEAQLSVHCAFKTSSSRFYRHTYCNFGIGPTEALHGPITQLLQCYFSSLFEGRLYLRPHDELQSCDAM